MKPLIPLLLAFMFLQGEALAQVSIAPANPKLHDTVRVKVAPMPISPDFFFLGSRRVTMAGNKITVVVDPAPIVGVALPSPTQAADIVLGQFPAGSYEVEVMRVSPSGTETISVGTASFVVSQRSAGSATPDPLQNNTDIWWNPNESGWGLNVVQHGMGNIFATWFNYAADGRAIWYVIPNGRWESAVQFRGPIYRTTGPEVLQTFNPAAVTVTQVGSALLYFESSDSTRMTAELTVDSRTVIKQLQRQPF